MNSLKKCRVAVIGVGQRGCAFAELAADNPESELVAVCDSDIGRATEFLNEIHLCNVPCRSNVEALLEKDSIDAAVVATPDFVHTAAAVPLLKRGIPVLLEKPMAPAVSECREILSAQTEGGALLQIGFELREHPMFLRIRELLRDGRLGQILTIHADESIGVMHGASYMRRWHRKSVNSGGFLLAKCSHDLDLLSWFAGEFPNRVFSFGNCDFFRSDPKKTKYCSECSDGKCRFRFQGEMVKMTGSERKNPAAADFGLCVFNDDKDIVDNQLVLLEYPSGLRASFALNLFAPTPKRTLKIVGSAGYLEADDDHCAIRIEYSDGHTPETINCKISGDSGHEKSDRFFFADFIRNVATGKRSPVDGAIGLAVNLIAEAAEASRKNGRAVELPAETYLVPTDLSNMRDSLKE